MWIYRLVFVFVCLCVCVCTVTDFSTKDKASGVIFCTAVYRRPRQGISHFCELCSPEAQNLMNRPPRVDIWPSLTTDVLVNIACNILLESLKLWTNGGPMCS